MKYCSLIQKSNKRKERELREKLEKAQLNENGKVIQKIKEMEGKCKEMEEKYKNTKLRSKAKVHCIRGTVHKILLRSRKNEGKRD